MNYSEIFFTRFEFVPLHFIIIMQDANQMNQGKSIFAQLMSLFPEYIFRQCVARYNGDRHKIKFNCRDQFMVMSFAQLTSQQSLRTNEAALTAFEGKLYHAGLSLIPRSTLGEMNEKKDWRIYHDLAQYLIKKARKLYDKEYYRLDIDEMVYAFDSSTIELCLKLCPWADFHHGKGAVKIHTLLSLRGSIPTFVHLTEGKVHDSKAMDSLPIEAFAYYLMDKGYVDFKRLYKLFHRQHAFFVTRAKNNMKYSVVEERPVDKITGLISDQDIELSGPRTSTYYPERIRLVVYEDYATNNVYKFITNDLGLPALTIAELYRERWKVETFFKFVKGNLHIKSFYGTSRNAVYTQIWIAVCDYLLLVIAKKMFHIDCELYILAQSIGLVLFEKEPINEIFKRNKSNEPINEIFKRNKSNKNVKNDGQLYLWPDFSGQ